MAHTLNLVWSSTTLNLTSGSYALVRYIPRYDPTKDTVTESAVIHVSGLTVAALQANISAIKTMFTRARKFINSKSGYAVYVNFQPTGAASLGRSRVFDGTVTEPDSLLAGDWANLECDVNVSWTRQNFWELPLVTLSLTTPNGAQNLARMYECHDLYENMILEKRAITALIAAAAVTGDLPAPAKFTISSYDNTSDLGMIIALNTEAAPTTYNPRIEAESGTGGTKIPASANYNLYSGGYARQYTLSSTLAKLDGYAITSLASLAGTWVGVALACTAGIGDSVELQVRITINNTPVYTGPIVRADGSPIQMFDQIYMPGAPDLDYALTPVSLEIWGRTSDTGTPLVIDALYVLPLAGLRRLDVITDSITFSAEVNNYTFVDDPYENQLYLREITDSATTISFTVTARGELYLTPGVDQQLLMLPRCVDYDPARSRTVRVYYRPRKATL